MISPDLFKPPKEIRELTLLRELESNPVISQRELSHKCGIALGITNACLKKMTLKGWIRVQDSGHQKKGYYITPKGLTEKSDLMLKIVSYNARHYGYLKDLITKILQEVRNEGVLRIVFYGVSEEREVAYLSLQGVGIELAGIAEDDDKTISKTFFGHKVGNVKNAVLLDPDGILITTCFDVQKKIRKLRDLFGGKKMRILHF
jgi:DNA-binding PadR family transcriptional regulator